MSEHRIEFAKIGSLSFISHLDFNGSFIRALKRAGLPLRYSEGFNPHPKISYALPLSVGMDGLHELVDISLAEEMTNKEVGERLAHILTDEFIIRRVETPKVKMKYVEAAEYAVQFPEYGCTPEEVKAALPHLPPVVKRSKSGEKTVDVSSMILASNVKIKDDTLLLGLRLPASGETFLNPELVITALREAGLDLPDGEKVTRTKILFKAPEPKPEN